MSSSVVQTKRAVWTSGNTSTAEQSTPCATSQARYSAKSPPTAPTSIGACPSTPSPNAMFAPEPPRRIAQVVDQEAQRYPVELVDDELVCEPPGEVHEVVGRDGTGDGDGHGGSPYRVTQRKTPIAAPGSVLAAHVRPALS